MNNLLTTVTVITTSAERTAQAVAGAASTWDLTLQTYTQMMRETSQSV